MDTETRTGLEELRRGLAGLRMEMAAGFERVERALDLLAIELRENDIMTEDLRSRVYLLTERLNLSNAALDRLRNGIARDMNAGFAVVHAAIGALRGDGNGLRARL